MTAPPHDAPIGPGGAPARPSFDDVYRAHVRPVWRTLATLGVRPADVQDAAQEVFCVVYQRLPTYDWRHPIGTWIYAIALRTAAWFRRKAHVRRELPVASPTEEVDRATPHEHFEGQRAVEALVRILARLDDEKREVFVLFEVHELSMREVAEIVGCPLQTAYSRLYAARRQLEAERASLRPQELP